MGSDLGQEAMRTAYEPLRGRAALRRRRNSEAEQQLRPTRFMGRLTSIATGLTLLALTAWAAQAQTDPAEGTDPLSKMEARLAKTLTSYKEASEYRKTCARHGQHDRAIKFFQDQVAAQPEHWRARLELSCAFVDKIPTCRGVAAFVSQGNLARKALDQMDLYVQKNPDAWVGYYARGINHLHWPRALRHSDDAVRDLSQCVAIQEKRGGQAGRPWHVKAHIALGDACTKAGKYEEGREAWRRGLKLFPDSRELKTRLETKDDQEQLSQVEAWCSLDRPVDTDLSFLDEDR